MQEEKHIIIGEILKTKRQELKLSIADVSAALRVKKDWIDLIEKGDYLAIDKNFYTVGFTRSYAKFLKIAESEIEDKIKEVSKINNQDDYKNKLKSKDLSPDDALFYKAILAVALIIVGLLLVFNLSSNEKLYEEKIENFYK